ncbi:urease accessory UreF family protein [Prosthecobacter fluviatilis]|uniref:Urease accessory UreF family protein n=1 Tax=Prosthecobacter fluviatilis TaxID=445931 RepID=A0ABW0KNT1_9BACT
MAAEGVAVEMKLHLLPSITLLPPPHEKADDTQIIEDWARGLDWVKWLLGSVRARVEVLMVEEPAEWDHFAQHLLREAVGPALKAAWLCARANDLEGLAGAAEQLSAQLPAGACQRSLQAGAVLLKSTKHARYQGVLGRLREAVDQGRCCSHIAVVWATVGHFFQLSLTNVIAEYLRLEWDMAARDTTAQLPYAGKSGIAGLTSQVMRDTTTQGELRVVDA